MTNSGLITATHTSREKHFRFESKQNMIKLNYSRAAVAFYLAVAVIANGDELKPKDESVAETQRASRLEAEADFTASYSMDGKLDIGVGRTDKETNMHYPVNFTFDEVEGFFDDQKHKNLIIITIAKNIWTEKELKQHVERLRNFFVNRGYHRIVVEQAYAFGRGIHLDHTTRSAERGDAVRLK